MQQHGIEMTVLVKNRPIFEYQHNDQVFVEGRAGSNYEIELRNHTNGRVQAVLSIDGLSAIDGKPAGTHSRSYLLDPYGTLRVPGWLLDAGNAAKFAFASQHNSYASQMSEGQSPNVGVIGVLVYREKITYPGFPTTYQYTYTGVPYTPPFYHYNMMTTPLSVPNFDLTYNGNAPLIGASLFTSTSTTSASAASPTAAVNCAAPKQTLGTAFGEQTHFATRAAAFDRGEQLVMMSLYYDSLRGLRAKGVPIERRRGKIQHRTPEAFPGMLCQPPTGWRVRGSLAR